jgi:type VI secretion system protein VasG
LAADLNKTLDRLKTGNSRSPALAPNIVKLVREAWLCFSPVQCRRYPQRHLLAALLGDDGLAALARRIAAPGQDQCGNLRLSLVKIVADSSEAGASLASGPGAASPAAGAPAASSAGGSALEQYTINLTARAREARLIPRSAAMPRRARSSIS